jgi:protein O-GlcNAc transferase
VRIPYQGCPLCGREGELRRTSDCSNHPCYDPRLPAEMRWMACVKCDHEYTDGYWSPEALEIIFSKAQECQFPGYNALAEREKSADIVREVARIKPSGKWLDIGFGNGNLMFTADEFGYQTIGTDLRPSVVESMKAQGFDARCSDIAEVSDRVDVISMCDVLEHVPFPKKTLARAQKLLLPGGVLVLSMPNIDSWFWRAATHGFFGELEHYHNFGRKRLCSLLIDHRFTPRAFNVSRRYPLCMEVIATR